MVGEKQYARQQRISYTDMPKKKCTLYTKRPQTQQSNQLNNVLPIAVNCSTTLCNQLTLVAIKLSINDGLGFS
jgi:hypothetical protein